MEKTFNMLYREYENKLIEVTNSFNLPLVVKRDVLNKVITQVEQTANTQYQTELKQYQEEQKNTETEEVQNIDSKE